MVYVGDLHLNEVT